MPSDDTVLGYGVFLPVCQRRYSATEWSEETEAPSPSHTGAEWDSIHVMEGVKGHVLLLSSITPLRIPPQPPRELLLGPESDEAGPQEGLETTI